MALPTNVAAGTAGHTSAHSTIHGWANTFDATTAPAAGQVPLYDVVSGTYKPGFPVVTAVMLGQDAIDSLNTRVLAAPRTTSYTLVAGDQQTTQEWNTASPVTVTVPADATAAFPVGAVVRLQTIGTGTFTVAAGTGVTLRRPAGLSLTALGQNSQLRLDKRAANDWLLTGDLA